MATKKRKPKLAPRAPDRAAAAAIALLSAVLAGTSLAVDTGAAAAFDAPKRLAAILGTALAAALVFAWRPADAAAHRPWRAEPRAARAALFLAAAALAFTALSALASPRRAIAFDGARTVVLFALLVPLGASRILPRGGRWLIGAFLAGCGVNAVVSLLQSRGLFHPFFLETAAERQDTGAYAGNVGYLAIALALGVVVALGALLAARGRAVRILCAAALLLFGAGLVVNRNLTALTAAAAGALVLLVLRLRRRAAVPALAVLLAGGAAVALYPPLRVRARELSRAARSGQWDALVSFRGGPWAAALDMTRERPIVGFGPGTFGAEYVPHRLAAEVRTRRRLVSPLLTSSYGEAHSDYLQGFSDAGIPAGACAVGAVVCLFAAIGARVLRDRNPEAILLTAVLATGAAAALTWFPLQRPITAVPLLLAAGRAWRVAGLPKAEAETAEAPS